MGFFRTQELDTPEKPFTLGVNMNSEIEVYSLPSLAKHILWIDENIPTSDREVDIQKVWWDGKYHHKITVRWTEQRGKQETFDV